MPKLEARPRLFAATLVVVGILHPSAEAEPPPSAVPPERPTVASINLCTDQLVLELADPAQIVTLSWLSADPEESLFAGEAARYPLNYGTAEELLAHAPDVVIAGAYTNGFTRALLRDLGFTVVDVMPADSIADIEDTLLVVGSAIRQQVRAEALIAEMRARRRTFEIDLPDAPVDAVVVRPGGFTVDAGSLAHELMTLAGLRNVPAAHGLDRWGSLSVETLLRTEPELLIVTSYRDDAPSLANTVLAHPALQALADRIDTLTIPSGYWGCGLPDSLDSVDIMQRAARALRAREAQ